MFHNEWKLCPEVLEIRYVLKYCISNSQMVGLICPPILIDELNAKRLYTREPFSICSVLAERDVFLADLEL